MKSVIGGPVRGHVQVELLSAYLDQQASPAERAYVDAHVHQCTECRAELDSLRRTVMLLQALPRVPVPRAFTLSEAQVGIRRPGASPNWLGGLVRGLGAVAAIALVAFVALSVLKPGEAPWNPSAQTVARAVPTPQPIAKIMSVQPAASTAPAQAEQSQPEAPVAAKQVQATAEIAPTPSAEPAAALAAAPSEPPTATSADTATARSAAQNAPAPTQPVPTSTGAAPLAAKAAPSPEPSSVMGAAAAAVPEPSLGAMGRGGGGPSEASIPPEFLTPEPTPQGRPLATALPSGVRIVYADMKALWAVDRDGGVRQLVQGQGISMPQLSPDQQWIVYRTYGDIGLKVWAIRWEGGQPKLLLDDATLSQDNLPDGYARRALSDTRWAPKGDVLAVTMSLVPDPDSQKPPTTELWQLDVQTGDLRLSSLLGSAWRPYYSPDGKTYLVLEYGTVETPEGNLRLVDVKSGKSKTVMTFPASPGKNGYEDQVMWATDGKAAYVAIPTGDYGTPTPPNGIKLYRMSAAGDVKEVGEVDAVNVMWSPTATAMVYIRYLDETMANNELYVANADGSQPQLYASMNQGGFVSWSPKGTHFLYQDNFQIFVGAVGQAAKRLANATSVVNARWISDSSILASHDTGDGWLLALRDIAGSATGLLPLPRESMWDVRSH